MGITMVVGLKSGPHKVSGVTGMDDKSDADEAEGGVDDRLLVAATVQGERNGDLGHSLLLKRKFCSKKELSLFFSKKVKKT